MRVQLNTGLEYRGILACLDGYLNLALEQSEEFRDGQLQAKYGDCFIRGNNGVLKKRGCKFGLLLSCGYCWIMHLKALLLFFAVLFVAALPKK